MTISEKIFLKKLLKECINESLILHESEADKFTGFFADKNIYDKILQDEFLKRKADLADCVLSSHFPFISVFPLSDENPKMILHMNPVRIYPRISNELSTDFSHIDTFIQQLNREPEALIIIDEQKFKEILNDVENSYKEELKKLLDKIKLNKENRKRALDILQEYMSKVAEEDAGIAKKSRSPLYKYFKEIIGVRQQEGLLNSILLDLIRQDRDAFNSTFGIKTLQKFLDKYSEVYNRSFDDNLQAISQQNLAAKQGRGTIESYWGNGEEADIFLDWLYDRTNKIEIRVGNSDQIDNIIEITPSNIPDFSDKVIISDGRWYQSWELQLDSTARKQINDVKNKLSGYDSATENLTEFDKMIQKMLNWEIAKFKTVRKGGEAEFVDRYVYQDDSNTLTGNNIIKDLVFNYGFDSKIK